MARKISQGLTSKALRTLEAATGLPRRAIFDAAHIPQRTGARQFKAGRFNDNESERIARLARIVDRAEDLMGDRQEGIAWLQKPHFDLGHQRPMDLAGSDLGAQEVEALISRLEDGVF